MKCIADFAIYLGVFLWGDGFKLQKDLIEVGFKFFWELGRVDLILYAFGLGDTDLILSILLYLLNHNLLLLHLLLCCEEHLLVLL